jgi:recombination protein RecA
VKVVKNKVAAPFRQAEFDIEYGHGISSEGCILDLGLEHDIVQKSGSFFSYGEERLGQGRNNAKAYLRENTALTRTIEEKVYAAVGMAPRDGTTPLPAATDVVGAQPEAEADAEAEAPVVQAA